MNSSVRRRMKRFLAASFQNRGYERFDSYPLDRLDPEFAPRAHWLDAGLACFALARELRDERRYPVTIAVTFALQAASAPRGKGYRDADELAADLGDSPPALLLLPAEPDFLEGRDPNEVHPGVLGLEAGPELGCLLEEWRFPEAEEEDAAYERSLILFSGPPRG